MAQKTLPSSLEDVTAVVKDAALVTVGLGVIAFQRFQVRRVELTKAMSRKARRPAVRSTRSARCSESASRPSRSASAPPSSASGSRLASYDPAVIEPTRIEPETIERVRAVVLCWNNVGRHRSLPRAPARHRVAGPARRGGGRQRVHRRLGGSMGATPSRRRPHPDRSEPRLRRRGEPGAGRSGRRGRGCAGELRRVRRAGLAASARRRTRPDQHWARRHRRSCSPKRPRGRRGSTTWATSSATTGRHETAAMARSTPAQFDHEEEVWGWCGAAVLLRRRYLEQVGHFDERLFMYAEDADLSWRGARQGWRYRYVPASVVRHEHRASSGGVRTPRLDYLNRRNRLVVVDPARGGPGRADRVGPGARRDRRWRGSRPGRSLLRGDQPDLAQWCSAGAGGCGCGAASWSGGIPGCRTDGPAVPLTRVRSMRALVTGGLGFVGRHLIEHLRASGDEVDVVDRHGDRAVDITNGPAVNAAIADVRPDAVYHLAGWADVGGSWAEPVAAFRANAEGTLNVLLACVGRRSAPGPVGGQRRRVRRGQRGGAAAHRGLAAPAGQPVRRQQGRRRLPRAAGLPRPGARRDPRAGVQPPRSGPDRPLRGARPRRAHRRQRARRRRCRRSSETCRHVATSPTCATSCAPTACWSSGASPARSTTSAAAATSPSRSWPTTCSPSPATRCSLETDPALLRPVDIPVLRGDASKLRDATGWQPRIPIDQTLADLLDDLRSRRLAG